MSDPFWKFETRDGKAVLLIAEHVGSSRGGWHEFGPVGGGRSWKEHGFNWWRSRKDAAMAYAGHQLEIGFRYPELGDGNELRRSMDAAYFAGRKDAMQGIKS